MLIGCAAVWRTISYIIYTIYEVSHSMDDGMVLLCMLSIFLLCLFCVFVSKKFSNHFSLRFPFVDGRHSVRSQSISIDRQLCTQLWCYLSGLDVRRCCCHTAMCIDQFKWIHQRFRKKKRILCSPFFSIHTTTTRLSMVLTKELQALLDEQPIHDRTIIRMVVWTNGNSYRYQSQIHSKSEEIEDKKNTGTIRKALPAVADLIKNNRVRDR